MLIDPENPRLWIALLAVHITAGAIAVTVGVLPLVSRKGGGFHCRWGRVFGWSMTIVVGAAALLSLLAPRPAFVVLTLSAGLQLFSGLRVLGRKRPDLDPAQRAIALDWGVTLGILAGAGVTAVWVLNGGGGYSAVATWAAVGGVFVFGLWDLLRFAAPTGWPFFPRLHRSAIVNLAKVRRAAPLADGAWRLELESGAEALVSRSYREALLARLPAKPS